MDATTTAAVLGKYSGVIAGFIGSVLSLTLLRDLTRWEAVCAVSVGFCSSVFTTALATSFFHLPADARSSDGVAFLIGLLAMNIIPMVKAALGRISGKAGS